MKTAAEIHADNQQRIMRLAQQGYGVDIGHVQAMRVEAIIGVLEAIFPDFDRDSFELNFAIDVAGFVDACERQAKQPKLVLP